MSKVETAVKAFHRNVDPQEATLKPLQDDEGTEGYLGTNQTQQRHSEAKKYLRIDFQLDDDLTFEPRTDLDT